MLINRVKEDDDKNIYEKGDSRDTEDYQTANELFEIMSKNQHRNNYDENKTLTTRDLVILYENADLGLKPVTSSKELVNKRPNQYVETIVYKDDNDSEDSDIYEIYSNEDLNNVVSINNERIDLLTSMASFENSLCHKYGNTHMKSSNLSNDYDRHFLFNDPLINEQLQSLHAMSNTKDYKSTILPASLLDYICCNRFDDNHSFYMDNVIKYVQHTIEQLKRISNGDYLTDKAKEKWREVQHIHKNDSKTNDNICLPPVNKSLLPIEEKVNTAMNTWDEIVHSEMDIRCLTKMLEKKVILEIPKILSGSYGIFTKYLNHPIVLKGNKIKKPSKIENKEKSIVEVILNLNQAETKDFLGNNHFPLKSLPLALDTKYESPSTQIFSVQIKNVERNSKNKIKIIEVDDNGNDISQSESVPKLKKITEHAEAMSPFCDEYYDPNIDFISSFEEFNQAGQEINQNTVLKEIEDCSTRKKSPTRVRIKSPYENKSHAIEEKRRKRLLEIREKREKKKIAMNESCKITKHKYNKGAIMAQPSNSVTKLSITNKSFYNSIYGQTQAVKTLRNSHKFQKQNNIPDLQIHECDEEDSMNESSNHRIDSKSQKYINRSYYLDDADTEVMYSQISPNRAPEEINEFLTPSTSMLSNDIGTSELHFNNPSSTDFSHTDTTTSLKNYESSKLFENKTYKTLQNFNTNDSILVPSNTPKRNDSKHDKNKSVNFSDECKNKIVEIYDLMNTIVSSTDQNYALENKVIYDSGNDEPVECSENNSTCETDSGTSVKHQLTSSPSSLDLKKEKTLPQTVTKLLIHKNIETATSVVPKVILNSKYQAGKPDSNKIKKEVKKVDHKCTDNPLKAISQLIHDIDNIQKTKHKSGNETKRNHRKNYNPEENGVRPLQNKPAIIQQKNIKQNNTESSQLSKGTLNSAKAKLSPQGTRHENASMKKKLTDIIDEVKEMRGEAVRGPSKGTSRIDSLAKPKKAYLKPSHEEHQNRFNRNAMPKVEKSTINPIKYRSRQKTGTDIPPPSIKQLHKIEHSPDTTVKFSRPANGSPAESYVRLQPAEAAKVTRITKELQTDPLQKKMVAVETYVKHHFSRLTPTIVSDPKDHVQKSRVPLIPTDLASSASSPLAEESTTLGNKLHDIINSKITTTASNLMISLGKGSTSKTDLGRVKSFHDLTNCPADIITSISDYPIDVFKDKNIITAVACVSDEDSAYKSFNQLQEPSLDKELRQLESALYRQISSGSFQKRLKIKKLTLTPKHSTQLLVVQSGDDRSLMVKTSMSQKIDFSKTHNLSKINLLPAVTKDVMNWNLPMQIATVGFVFPEYETRNDYIHMKTGLPLAEKCSVTVQCYKESDIQPNYNSIINNNTAHIKDINSLQEHQNNIDNSFQKCVCDENEINKQQSDNISNSTSLDILVGLLNEIKKITTCESNYVSPINENNSEDDCKELKFILNNTKRDKETVSMSSLDKLQYMQSSNLSLSTSSIDDKPEIVEVKENENICNGINIRRPLITDTADKAIDVQNSKREVSDGCNDIPSGIFPSTVNRSTGAISTLMAAVVDRYSSESCSFTDCQTMRSKSSFNETKALIPYEPKNNSLLALNLQRTNTQIDHGVNSKLLKVIYENDKNKNLICTEVQNNIGFDSTLKVKRDALVTLYSLLVLTVFAALTFPGILFNT